MRASSGGAAGDEAGTAEAWGESSWRWCNVPASGPVDDHREEVDPPSDGASTRLGLEPRSHRQQLPLERQHHKLTKDEKWWSDEDGSDESSRRGHGCGKSQGGTNDDGGSMSCRADSIRKSAPCPPADSTELVVGVDQDESGDGEGEGGKGHGHVGTGDGELVAAPRGPRGRGRGGRTMMARGEPWEPRGCPGEQITSSVGCKSNRSLLR